MTREYTNYLKGIAILMMLFLHLFNNIEWDTSLKSILYIKELPLVYYLSRMCNPVPFFLILSGYGLYAVYIKLGGVKPWKRVCNLYLHLWLVYLIIVPLACYVKPEMYPGSLSIFLKNITSWHCSYIGEQWFLFPYILLMISSKWIFLLFDKINWSWLVTILVSIWIGTVFILKQIDGDVLSSNMLFYNVFLAIFMLPSFMLGYMTNRYGWVQHIADWFAKCGKLKSILPIILLIALSVFRCFISHSSISHFYAILFVLLFAQIPIGKYVGIVLTYLGKHSMNIWLIHTWFSTRLFHEFFFDQIQIPVLMYVVLLVLSLSVSHLVELMYKPLSGFVSRIKY